MPPSNLRSAVEALEGLVPLREPEEQAVVVGAPVVVGVVVVTDLAVLEGRWVVGIVPP